MESFNRTRTLVNDAVRFWEPRRIAYNLVLMGVTVFWFALDWHHFRPALHLRLLLVLLVLAGLANVCYCAAYVVDIPFQYSIFRVAWRRRRWWLWLAGVLLGALLASYWINDEIYSGVGVESVSHREAHFPFRKTSISATRDSRLWKGGKSPTSVGLAALSRSAWRDPLFFPTRAVLQTSQEASAWTSVCSCQ